MKAHEQQWSSMTPGLLIILIDQSGSMLLPYKDNESRTTFASNAVNKVINAIIQVNFNGDRPKDRCFISVIGYNNNVKELCSGYVTDFFNNPIRIDSVKKKVSDGAGGLVEIDHKMPIWVEPIDKDGAKNMKGAFLLAKQIIEKWNKEKPHSPTPIIINISDGTPYFDGKDVKICMEETIQTAQDIMQLSSPDGNVLIFNTLIGNDTKYVFPVSRDELDSVEAQFIFDISSPIPEAYKAAAEKYELVIKAGSHGCICQADAEHLANLYMAFTQPQIVGEHLDTTLAEYIAGSNTQQSSETEQAITKTFYAIEKAITTYFKYFIKKNMK